MKLGVMLPLLLLASLPAPTQAQTTRTYTLSATNGFNCNTGYGQYFQCSSVPIDSGGAFSYVVNSQAQSVAFNNVINGGYDTAAVLTDVGTGATLPGTPVNARYTFTFVGVDSATKKPFSGSGTIYMDVFFNGSKRHPATIYVLYAGSVSVTE